MDRKKEAEKLRQSMLEHKRKLGTDPEYRKRCAEIDRKFSEHLLGYKKDDE